MAALDPVDVADFERAVALQNSLGVPSRIVSPAEIKEMVPSVQTDDLVGGGFRFVFMPGFHLRREHAAASEEIDRVLASGAGFGCVLADAEYGKVAAQRRERLLHQHRHRGERLLQRLRAGEPSVRR